MGYGARQRQTGDAAEAGKSRRPLPTRSMARCWFAMLTGGDSFRIVDARVSSRRSSLQILFRLKRARAADPLSASKERSIALMCVGW